MPRTIRKRDPPESYLPKTEMIVEEILREKKHYNMSHVAARIWATLDADEKLSAAREESHSMHAKCFGLAPYTHPDRQWKCPMLDYAVRRALNRVFSGEPLLYILEEQRERQREEKRRNEDEFREKVRQAPCNVFYELAQLGKIIKRWPGRLEPGGMHIDDARRAVFQIEAAAGFPHDQYSPTQQMVLSWAVRAQGRITPTPGVLGSPMTSAVREMAWTPVSTDQVFAAPASLVLPVPITAVPTNLIVAPTRVTRARTATTSPAAPSREPSRRRVTSSCTMQSLDEDAAPWQDANPEYVRNTRASTRSTPVKRRMSQDEEEEAESSSKRIKRGSSNASFKDFDSATDNEATDKYPQEGPSSRSSSTKEDNLRGSMAKLARKPLPNGQLTPSPTPISHQISGKKLPNRKSSAAGPKITSKYPLLSDLRGGETSSDEGEDEDFDEIKGNTNKGNRSADKRLRERQQGFKTFEPESVRWVLLAAHTSILTTQRGLRTRQLVEQIQKLFPNWVKRKEESAAKEQVAIDERLAQEAADVKGKHKEINKKMKTKATCWKDTIRQERSRMGMYIQSIPDDSKANDFEYCLTKEYLQWVQKQKEDNAEDKETMDSD